jgi:hypothetical protein
METQYTPAVLGMIGVGVAAIVQGIKAAGFPRNQALWATAGASILAVLLFTWSKGTFSRETTWDMFMACVLVYTAAVAAYETVKTTGAGVQKMGGPDINDARSVIILIAIAGTIGLPACGKRYKPGTTVTQAMAYELDEGLKPLVGTQGKVIAAVDAACLPVPGLGSTQGRPANPEACAALKGNADKFLKVVDQLMALVEKEVSPRLKQLDAAIVALDAVRQGKLRADLVPFLAELSTLTAQAFGTALPDGLVAKATTLAGKSIETFIQLRDAITDLVNKIRNDAVGTLPPAPPTAAFAS